VSRKILILYDKVVITLSTLVCIEYRLLKCLAEVFYLARLVLKLSLYLCRIEESCLFL